MDFELAAQVSVQTLLFETPTSAVWLRFEWTNSVLRHRTPHEMLHHSDYTPSMSGMYFHLPPLHIATSEPADIDDSYDSEEVAEEEFWNDITDSYRSLGSGLSRETVTGYLTNVAGCSESEEICTICQDDIHANKERAKLCCGHVFHFGCIEDWLMVKNECPVCRAAAVPVRDREQGSSRRNTWPSLPQAGIIFY